MEKEEDTARVQQLRDHKFTLCGHRRRRTELKPGEDALLRPGLMGLQPARPSRRALSRVQPQIQNTQKNNDFFLGGVRNLRGKGDLEWIVMRGVAVLGPENEEK